jgi:hypothetical protein
VLLNQVTCVQFGRLADALLESRCDLVMFNILGSGQLTVLATHGIPCFDATRAFFPMVQCRSTNEVLWRA